MAGIPKSVFAARRRRFCEQLGEGVALLPGAHLAVRSNDVDYVFRQRSDLLYLTGFEHPDAVGVLARDRFVLFVQPRDPAAETWTGLRPGTDGALEHYGADAAYAIDELDAKLPELIETPRLFHCFGVDRKLDEAVHRAVEGVRRKARLGTPCPSEFVDPASIVTELRLLKDADELRVMREAADISREGHREAARLCRAGAHEYELEAALHHVFRRRGGAGPAYPIIVGGGENATILHYIENREPLRAGELCLIDAGVELHGYASDVTRTYPVDGSFQGIARDVYAAVLRAQEAALAEIRPGSSHKRVHEAALRVLCEELVGLGALAGDPGELLEAEAYRPFYMHSTGHWLGLDVHDVGGYLPDGKPRPFESGMVLTCEPGLYFSAREEKTPEALRGIGVRIEDDIVVTDAGAEILTAEIPKSIDDVEAWMRHA